LSTGNTEPAYNKNIDAGLVSDPNNPNSIDVEDVSSGEVVYSAICRNCTHWSDPPLDLTSTHAPFMFAVGPFSDDTNIRRSNSPSNPLRSHSVYATFTMDMQQATIPSAKNLQVPQLGNSTNGASPTISLTLQSHDYKSAFHAVAMCLAFVFLLQVDIVLRKCIRWIWFHLFIQGIVFVIFVVGLALGAVLSPMFIRVSISVCLFGSKASSAAQNS
jgi:hypothetical protein